VTGPRTEAGMKRAIPYLIAAVLAVSAAPWSARALAQARRFVSSLKGTLRRQSRKARPGPAAAPARSARQQSRPVADRLGEAREGVAGRPSRIRSPAWCE